MEDEKIKDIFKGFQPELPSADLFMSKLKAGMNSVQLVKRHQASLKRRNKLAVIVAAIVGFLSGVIMTLLLPLMVQKLSALSITLPYLLPGAVEIDWNIMAWILTSIVCAVFAFNAYEITISRLAAKEAAT